MKTMILPAMLLAVVSAGLAFGDQAGGPKKPEPDNCYVHYKDGHHSMMRYTRRVAEAKLKEAGAQGYYIACGRGADLKLPPKETDPKDDTRCWILLNDGSRSGRQTSRYLAFRIMPLAQYPKPTGVDCE
jgi:hypothetical protein